MRTTTIVWPEATLGCPLRSTWRAVVQPRFATATLNPLISTFGPNQIDEVRMHEVGFVWTVDQLAAFEAFYETTLSRGMAWFMMDFPVAGVVVPTYSHIEGGYRIGDTEGWVAVNFSVNSYRRIERATA